MSYSSTVSGASSHDVRSLFDPVPGMLVTKQTLSTMPLEIVHRVICFYPDSVVVLRAASRGLSCFIDDYLEWNIGEIHKLPGDTIPRLHPWIVTCAHLVPDRFGFHFALTRTIGRFFSAVQREACRPNQILGVSEIKGLENRIERNENRDLQEVWSQLHGKAQLPEGVPGPNAPVEEIRLWMHGREGQQVLRRIRDLNLCEDQLTCVPGEIALFLGLRELDLANNRLTWLPEGCFQGLLHLHDLDLAGNALRYLPENLFRGLFRLRSLGLGANDLAWLPENLFLGLNNLQSIFLYGNQLTFLPENLFQGLTLLEDIYLESNCLGQLPENLLKGLNRLRALYLDHNVLDILPGKFLQGNSRLEVLHISYNRLSSLPTNLLQRLPRLHFLALDHNHLVSFPQTLFDGFNNLEVPLCFSVSGNPSLLFFHRDEERNDDFVYFTKVMHGFYHYRCKSPLARFYQSIALSSCMEDVKVVWAGLENSLRRVLPAKVRLAAGLPTGDTQWDAQYPCHDIITLGRVLKKHIVERLDSWTSDQIQRLHEHTAVFARIGGQSGTPSSDFFPQDNILMLIDGMELFVEKGIDFLSYECESSLASCYQSLGSGRCRTATMMQGFVSESFFKLGQEDREAVYECVDRSAQIGTGDLEWDRFIGRVNPLRRIDAMVSLHLLQQQPQGRKRRREDVSQAEGGNL